MTTILISAVTLVISLLGAVQTTEVNQCTNGPLPDSVEIQNCDQQPCIFYINATATMTMTFKSPRRLEHIAPNALAEVLGLSVLYPLGQDDACDGIVNAECPLEEGQVVEYTYDMFILPIFPKVDLTLEFSLIDLDNDREQVECFKVDIQLEDAPLA